MAQTPCCPLPDLFGGAASGLFARCDDPSAVVVIGIGGRLCLYATALSPTQKTYHEALHARRDGLFRGDGAGHPRSGGCRKNAGLSGGMAVAAAGTSAGLDICYNLMINVILNSTKP